jgi:hypothetical protein
MQLLESTGVHEEGYNTRFAVIDEAVDAIYGEKIRAYFTAQDIDLTTIVIQGGEPDKRPVVSLVDIYRYIYYLLHHEFFADNWSLTILFFQLLRRWIRFWMQCAHISSEDVSRFWLLEVASFSILLEWQPVYTAVVYHS